MQPCDCSPTDRVYLPRLFPCRGSASLISCWVVHGHPPFRGFSPPVAAGPSRALLSPLPFPTLRCRGSEEFSVALHLHLAASMSLVEHPPSPCGSDVTRWCGCVPYVGVVHAAVGPLLSWSFLPFEDDLPASSHTSAGLLSWASIVRGSPLHPLAGIHEPARTCALQSVREPEVRSVSPDLPPWGLRLGYPPRFLGRGRAL